MASIVNLIALLCAMLAMTSHVTQAKKVRMCYYTSWAKYRQGKGHYDTGDIDPHVCTHILYAFAGIDVGSKKLKTLESDDKDNYRKIVALKRENPDLKVLLALGGANEHAWKFDQVASSQSFVDDAIRFLRQHHLDGLDVDWEFPSAATKQNFQHFLDLLSEGFKKESKTSGKDRLILTVAVWGNHEKASEIYMPAKVAKAVDYVLIMAYDLWGSWSGTLGHHSPLYVAVPGKSEQGRYSVNKVVEEWQNLGAPYQKLVMGMGTYGRNGLLSSASQHDLGDPWTKQNGAAGPFTGSGGILAYYEICDKLQEDGWTVKHTTRGEAAYAWNSRTLEFICYDDERSVQAKAEYILDKDLGGAMFWTIDEDDFSGSFCNNGKYPLINKVKSVLEGGDTSGSGTPKPKPGTPKPKPGTPKPKPGTPKPKPVTSTSKPVTPRPSTRPPVVASTAAPSNKDCGTFKCTTDFGFFPNPSNCGTYYRCVHRKPVMFTCAGGLQFDKDSLQCTYTDKATCATC